MEPWFEVQILAGQSFERQTMRNNTALVILAAGYGKRFGGENQKTLTKILGKPLIAYLIDTVKKCNPERIVIVVGFQKERVIEELKGENVIFVEQTQLLGTGHAVMTCKKVFYDFNGNILILCGDVPFLTLETIRKLQEVHNQTCADCTVLTAIVDNPYGYGRIKRNQQGEMEKIVEELSTNPEEKQIREINSGVYMFKKKELFESLNKIQPNPIKKEYYLTDVVEIFIKNGKKVSTWTTQTPEEIIGINTMQDLMKAKQYLSSLRRKK